MNLNDGSAANIAEFLLQVKAIKLQPSSPFTWASGLRSPIYCDNRITLSYPKIRTYIRQQLVKSVTENFGKPDVIAGVATGGIAQGALVAQDMGLPFVYIRSESKSHGMGNLIEGVIESGQSVVIIEDLISTGQSSLKAVKALRESGCNVKGMISIFTYGLKKSTDAFKKNKCPLVSLCNYDVLLQQAIDSNYITDKDLNSLRSWKENPDEWVPEL